MNAKTTFASVVLATSAVSAQAELVDWISSALFAPPKDFGAWLCTQCSLPSPGEPTATTGVADVSIFIRAIANDLFSDTPRQQWVPGQRITVCNSSGICITVFYRSATVLWLPELPTFAKPPNLQVNVPSQQPSTALPVGSVAVAPLGSHMNPYGEWTLTFPSSSPFLQIPSVTVIQNSEVVSYSATSEVLEPLSFNLIETWGWSTYTLGLEPYWGMCTRYGGWFLHC